MKIALLLACGLLFLAIPANCNPIPTGVYQSPRLRLNVSIRTDNKNDFEVGTPRVLACVVFGCVSSPNVTWYLGGTMLRPNVYKEVNRGNFTVSSLTFVPSITDNGKQLICRVSHERLTQVYEDRVIVNVGQRPNCAVSSYTKIRAVEGKSETLVCVVESVPDPEQFIWEFADGRNIYTSSKKVPGYKSRYSSSLVWVPRRDDYGPLYCRAFNRYGAQKQPCQFSIVDAATPDCHYGPDTQDSTLPCSVSQIPDDAVERNHLGDEIVYGHLQNYTRPTEPNNRYVDLLNIVGHGGLPVHEIKKPEKEKEKEKTEEEYTWEGKAVCLGLILIAVVILYATWHFQIHLWCCGSKHPPDQRTPSYQCAQDLEIATVAQQPDVAPKYNYPPQMRQHLANCHISYDHL